MAYDVFVHGRQFADAQSLSEAIQAAWESIAVTIIKHYCHSIPHRLILVIEKRAVLSIVGYSRWSKFLFLRSYVALRYKFRVNFYFWARTRLLMNF